MSVFSGALSIPISTLDQIYNIPILLQTADNTIIPTFIAILMALYLILLLWAAYRDITDEKKVICTLSSLLSHVKPAL